jgi:hypothetical protein
MVRKTPSILKTLAQATLPAAILVASASAQTPATPTPAAADHTVVRGETLWELAGRYLGNPFSWPSIHEMNRTLVPDPHWIYPGQQLRIPGARGTTQVGGVAVIPAEGTPVVEGVVPQQAPGVRPGPGEPTVFLRDEVSGVRSRVIRREESPWHAVPRDVFLAADWIEAGEENAVPRHEGWISGFEGVAGRAPGRETADLYSEVRITVTGQRTPQPGDVLVAFRPGDPVPGEGRIAHPTGLLVVRRIDGAGIVARVERPFDRVRLDDLVVPAPTFGLAAGVYPAPVEGGFEARILAFARPHELQVQGDIAFLDVGSAQGVRVGDEFVAVASRTEGWTGTVAGRLQVVGVREGTASARIVAQDGAIFQAGLPVQLARKMP